ncbi:MAG: type II secretion system F family protein [Gemmobacter sp.]
MNRASLDLIDPDLLLYAGVFLGVLLAWEGLRQILRRSETAAEAKCRRLRMIARGARPDQVLAILAPKETTGLAARLPFARDLPRLVRQSGLPIRTDSLLLLCLLGTVMFTALSFPFVPIIVSLPLALVLFVGLPLLAVKVARDRRIARLTAQLPDALDLMARGLKVGHPINATVQSVAEDMPDPIATEFGILVDQVAYGDDLVRAFQELARRVDTEDFHYLAVTVGIQHGTGGNLGRVLTVLSKVVRDRAIMRRKITAISAEGRISAYILSAIPVLIVAGTMITAPRYYMDVIDDPMFRPIAIIAALLVVANALVLRRLVTFRF